MKLARDESGYYFFDHNGIRVVLFLSEDLFPEDSSLEKLRYIADTFPIHQRIVGLPDLHFKIKNFVPSGMTIPVKNGFSPLLLGPNNDGMGSLRFSVSGGKLSKAEIRTIFTTLKNRISMFRRREDVVDQDVLDNILQHGIRDQLTEWGFQPEEAKKFEDCGCAEDINDIANIYGAFPKNRPPSLPDFVPAHELAERGKKCLGVLDGTSHFVELYEMDRVLREETGKHLDIQEGEYYFLIHAGAGDVCLISHREYLDQEQRLFKRSESLAEQGWTAFAATANFGFANRLYIYKQIRETLVECVPGLEQVEIFSDVPHDYLELGTDDIFIHRKGAIKLQPAASFEVDHPWHQTGMPYVFPSSAGGDAYILTNKEGNELSFQTMSHGAGRMLPKDVAIEKYADEEFATELENNIDLFRYNMDQIEGQHPKAFKDMKTIMKLIQQFRLAWPVARLKPLASLKA